MGKYDPFHQQIAQWAADGQTLQYMADQIGDATLGGVRAYCIRAGIEYCKKTGWRPGTHTGENHHSWNGGRTVTDGGYIRVLAKWHPNADSRGRMAEHRLVMEQHIGRLLTRDEVVHHMDGNTSNNHPDNLRLYASNAAHIADHGGWEWSEEAKKNQSKTLKGRKMPPRSEEYRAKMSASLKGRTLSDETRKKLSEAALRRRPKTEEERLAISARMKAYHQDNTDLREKAVSAMNVGRRQQARQLRYQKDAATHQEKGSDGQPQR